VGNAYSTSLVAAGGSQPYFWTVTSGSLPEGVALNYLSGVLSGTPTSAGNFTFTIQVRDNTNDNTLKEFSMAVEGSPTATTQLASSITDTTATLNGLVNPQNLLTAVGFCYGTSPNFSDCTHVAASQSPLAAGISDVSVDVSLQGLVAGTKYYVRAEASNSSDSTVGNSISFTTSAAPTVTTGAVSNLTQTGTGARLNALVNPKSGQTAVSFCYSTSPTLVGCTSIPGTPSSLPPSTQPSAVSADVSGLTPNTVYYYYAVATNNVGTTYG
jgi:phosphodiesterase/alkaline phosphatase D-like protein